VDIFKSSIDVVISDSFSSIVFDCIMSEYSFVLILDYFYLSLNALFYMQRGAEIMCFVLSYTRTLAATVFSSCSFINATIASDTEQRSLSFSFSTRL
jgi:hypothetical protein